MIQSGFKQKARHLTLVQAVLWSWGCAPAPTPAVTVVASALPAATPTPAATPSLAASATPVPSALPSGGNANGTVYDQDGKPLAAIGVNVTSLDPSSTYTGSATTDANGHYALAGLPVGINLAFTTSKPGWTARRRLAALVPGAAKALDFGAACLGSAADACTDVAAPFYLSQRPEVSLVSPTMDGALVGADAFHFVLGFSAPLDATNQQRFARALRVLPADTYAQGGQAGATALASKEDLGFPSDLDLSTLETYQIKVGAIFRGQAADTARLSWSADGLTATFDFAAAALTGRFVGAHYQLALAAGDAPIVDTLGVQLGTANDGSFDGYPAAGHLVHSVFQSADLALATIPGLASGSREERWAATHDDAGRFSVPADGQAPVLSAVTIGGDGTDSTLALLFDKALVAYDGSQTGLLGAGLDLTSGLCQMQFAVAERPDILSDLTLTKYADMLDPRSTETFGLMNDRNREVTFTPAALATGFANVPTGTVVVGLDPLDTRRLLYTISERAHFFDASIGGIKARIQGLGDPAGNVSDEDFANQHVYSGAL